MLKSGLVKDYMSAHLVAFSPDMGVLQAISMLVKKRISGAPVIDKRGNLIGMLSEADCLKIAFSTSYHAETAGNVAEYMQSNVETVDADGMLPIHAAITGDHATAAAFLYLNISSGHIWYLWACLC